MGQEISSRRIAARRNDEQRASERPLTRDAAELLDLLALLREPTGISARWSIAGRRGGLLDKIIG